VKVDMNLRQQIDKLLDFAYFTIRALELYDSVRSHTTRELLLAELHQRYRSLNGAANLKKFQAHLSLLMRLISEISGGSEHIEASIECAEQLISNIERVLLSDLNENVA